MMLELAARAIGLGRVAIDELEQLAGNDEEDATRSRLLQSHVQWAVADRRARLKVLGSDNSERWLTYLAHVMIDHHTYQLSWWRSTGRAPKRVLAVAASLSMMPAYWLALQMPIGLTRGLAIGCGVGVGAAFLRARPMGWPTAPIVWCMIAGEVLLTGTVMRGWQQGTADALEIASSVTAAYLVLDTLLRSRWPRRFGRPPARVAALGDRAVGWWRRRIVAGARWTRNAPGWKAAGRWFVLVPVRRFPRLWAPVGMTLLAGLAGWIPPVVFRLMTGWVDPERKIAMVYIGTTFGIGLATVAARAYITKEETIPDEVRITWQRRAEPWYNAALVAVLFASSIGIGGAVGGWMRYGGTYALAVGVVPVRRWDPCRPGWRDRQMVVHALAPAAARFPGGHRGYNHTEFARGRRGRR